MKRLTLLTFSLLLIAGSTYSQSNWLIYTPANSGLPDIELKSIAIDKGNTKWLSAESSVINFDGTNWFLFDSTNSLLPSFFRGVISESGDGDVWLGNSDLVTAFGIIKLTADPWEVLNTSNSSLEYDVIAGLTESANGGIWINSYPGQLTVPGTLQNYNDGSWITLTEQTHNYTNVIEEDDNGGVWYRSEVLPQYGAFIIRNNSMTQYNFTKNETAFCYENDHNGNIWMGWHSIAGASEEDSAGLIKFDGNNWQLYTINNSNLFSSSITVIRYQAPGILLMSGPDMGLVKFNGLDLIHYTVQNSLLYSEDILDIEIDSYGNTWILHPDGISVFNASGLTSVDDEASNPTGFVLEQNYPNPFNPSTKISWQSPVGSWQTLKVYDVLGNEVAVLIDEYKPAGSYEVEFNLSAAGRQGPASGIQHPASGIYFYQLTAGDYSSVKKMVLLR